MNKRKVFFKPFKKVLKKNGDYPYIKMYLENEFLKETVVDNNCCTKEELKKAENFATRTATHICKTIKQYGRVSNK